MPPPQSGEAEKVNSKLQCGPAEDPRAAVAGESHAEEGEARTKERKAMEDWLRANNRPDNKIITGYAYDLFQAWRDPEANCCCFICQ
eukprot:4627507-Pleurochrysis_carterae.AAC.2